MHAAFGLDWELTIEIFKRRGSAPDTVLRLPSIPSGLTLHMTDSGQYACATEPGVPRCRSGCSTYVVGRQRGIFSSSHDKWRRLAQTQALCLRPLPLSLPFLCLRPLARPRRTSAWKCAAAQRPLPSPGRSRRLRIAQPGCASCCGDPVEAVWLAIDPLDMRSGNGAALARVVNVFGLARPHHAYLFANRLVSARCRSSHLFSVSSTFPKASGPATIADRSRLIEKSTIASGSRELSMRGLRPASKSIASPCSTDHAA